LDVILKLGALSVILAAVTVNGYLKTIGGAFLYPQFIGSQGGLFSIAFGLGLLFLAIFSSLIASPLLIRFFKNAVAKKKFVDSHSFIRIFLAIVVGQLFLLLCAICDASQLFLIAMPVFSAGCIVLFNKEKHSLLQILLIFVVCLAQFFSIFPWIYLIEILTHSEIVGAQGVDRDWFEFGGLFAWIVIYSLAVAVYVNHKKADSKESPLSYFKGLTIFCGLLLYLLLLSSPKFFINSSMSVASLRQTQKQSTWWYVDSAAYGRVSRVGNLHQSLKTDSGNTYLCGYSPFVYSERIVLCPQNVDAPNLKTCYVFTDIEARPAVVPEKGWDCGK
jgi:hypothetical protein